MHYLLKLIGQFLLLLYTANFSTRTVEIQKHKYSSDNAESKHELTQL